MEKLVYINKNTKDLRTQLDNIGFKLDQDWEEKYLDMCFGIVCTPENRYYVVTDETKPDMSECYDCFDDERLFTGVVKYYHWNNLPKKEQDRWCSYCGCEGGCNMCTSVNKVYNTLLVKYGHV